MHTNLLISQTRSIAIAAPPEKVFGFVSDPTTLPTWAPGFARTARPDGDHWIVENEQGENRIIVSTSSAAGTVDILPADLPGPGAFTRVFPNGTGSEFQFTILFPPNTPEDAITAQMTVVEEELHTIRTHCE